MKPILTRSARSATAKATAATIRASPISQPASPIWRLIGLSGQRMTVRKVFTIQNQPPSFLVRSRSAPAYGSACLANSSFRERNIAFSLSSVPGERFSAEWRPSAHAMPNYPKISAGKPALPRLMGVVNVTPDSFSDGGLFLDPSGRSSTGAS